MSGRGVGKTTAGANWVLQMALSAPGIQVAVCAPTFAQVRNVCFEGISGIEHEAEPGDIKSYNKSNLRIVTSNGSTITGYSAENIESCRGANLTYAWLDEAAEFPDSDFYLYGLVPALRIPRPDGGPPRVMITCTPKNKELIRMFMDGVKEDPVKYHFTRAGTRENINLQKDAVDEMYRLLGTSRRGIRQELEGELVLDVDGAFFQAADFDEYRVKPGEEPEMRRVVVGVDPATTSGTKSDETGIVVIGEGVNRNSYVLLDASLKGTPDEVMTTIQRVYWQYDCDLVIVERNAAGDYFTTLMAQKDQAIPCRSVQAMKGKKIRAEPIGHLNEVGRIHFVGKDFEKLERQLIKMSVDQDRSKEGDDRADAFVWAMVELTRKGQADWNQVYGFGQCKFCQKDVNYMQDKKCRSCGEPTVPDRLQKVTGMEKHAQRWWKAYTKECLNGHDNYSMTLKECPECHVNPAKILAQAISFSGQGAGKYAYTGKNPFSGRRY